MVNYIKRSLNYLYELFLNYRSKRVHEKIRKEDPFIYK